MNDKMKDMKKVVDDIDLSIKRDSTVMTMAEIAGLRKTQNKARLQFLYEKALWELEEK